MDTLQYYHIAIPKDRMKITICIDFTFEYQIPMPKDFNVQSYSGFCTNLISNAGQG